MVSAVVIQPFEYLGRNVYPGEALEMEPVDAAVKSHAGLVSLNHGTTYKTRHMVATEPEGCAPVPAASISLTQPDAPVQRRRRGRSRKTKA